MREKIGQCQTMKMKYDPRQYRGQQIPLNS
ncbi:hypothetical protein F985_02761 [Acinetobacter seifertii]|uniref:Uncharacterized protein n=1 Tax=Acinetobacter seifertii TaxID=1530123 RepID=N8S7S7_9GAMM|nr:hypothetical protein F985_02761 [Acinetobacter seifertii]